MAMDPAMALLLSELREQIDGFGGSALTDSSVLALPRTAPDLLFRHNLPPNQHPTRYAIDPRILWATRGEVLSRQSLGAGNTHNC